MPEDRFILPAPEATRPGRIPLPPAFAVKATTDDTEGRLDPARINPVAATYHITYEEQG
ncbi:hypothetical protein [Streptomyces sp. NPDC047061]|uniref:hypothetical protein n=1 Tax=Streptomyces sp. NPDC047061 TaxID=3154605 RepID=UPI00340D7467